MRAIHHQASSSCYYVQCTLLQICAFLQDLCGFIRALRARKSTSTISLPATFFVCVRMYTDVSIRYGMLYDCWHH